MFRFLHTADIHLDCSFKGFEAHANALGEEIYGATRKAFAQAIDEAVEITGTMPLLDKVTLFEPRSQAQELSRVQLLDHGELK